MLVVELVGAEVMVEWAAVMAALEKTEEMAAVKTAKVEALRASAEEARAVETCHGHTNMVRVCRVASVLSLTECV